MTFSIREPVGIDNALMEKAINSKNDLNGAFKIISSNPESVMDHHSKQTIVLRR